MDRIIIFISNLSIQCKLPTLTRQFFFRNIFLTQIKSCVKIYTILVIYIYVEENGIRKNPILTVMLCVMTQICFISCASTKDVAKTMKTNNIDVKAKNSVIVDWTGRTAGEEAIPVWLTSLVRGNGDVFKSEFGINNSYIIKHSVDKGKTEDIAKINSRVRYNAFRAEELRTKVISQAASTLPAGASRDAFENAAMGTPVTELSGHELVTQFCQQVITPNKETGLEESEFICYSIYKISRENWLETLKVYMKAVLPSLPDSDSKKKMAETISILYEDTTSNSLKSESEVIAEINAKQDAIHKSVPGTNPSDIEWLDVLETACKIIF